MSSEVITIIIIAILTIVNLFIGARYIISLQKDFDKKIFLYKDPIHSLQHLAIVWSTMLISVVILIESISNTSLPVQFLEHMLYNLACIFIIYPHLISEDNGKA